MGLPWRRIVQLFSSCSGRFQLGSMKVALRLPSVLPFLRTDPAAVTDPLHKSLAG